MRSFLGMLHLAAGFGALVAFWAPLFLKKGGKAHRTFGWIFVGAMSIILASAATMTVITIVTNAANRNSALFLGFLTLITFLAVWSGITVLRHKQDPGWMRSPFSLFITGVIALAGIGLIWQWLETGFVLFAVFGFLGVIIAVPELIRWRKPLKVEPRYWWFVHLDSMITAGMAAHIAFFAFGSMRIWPDLYTGHPWWFQLLPWVAPFPIAFAAIALLKRHYRRKFNPAGS